MPNRLSTLGLLAIAAASCAGSHAQSVRDARMEGIDARADAKKERAENRAERREDATDKRYEARAERIDEANRPSEDAQQELLDLSKDRADFRSQIQTRMEKLAIRINSDRQKLQVLGERAPTPTHTELSTVVEQYDLLKQDVQQLDSTPDTHWEAKRNDIQRRADMLDERVSKLDDKVASG